MLQVGRVYRAWTGPVGAEGVAAGGRRQAGGLFAVTGDSSARCSLPETSGIQTLYL